MMSRLAQTLIRNADLISKGMIEETHLPEPFHHWSQGPYPFPPRYSAIDHAMAATLMDITDEISYGNREDLP